MNVIENFNGPCLVLAGAGTGKTHTIVEKIKYLVNKKIYSPEKIVCITFSNEAANNLVTRIESELKDIARDKIIIRTFHGFSADLLRKYGDKIDISSDFKIIDSEQAMIILHGNLKVSPVNCRKYIETIGISKDLGISLDSLKEFLEKQKKKYSSIDIVKRMEDLTFKLQTIHIRNEGLTKSDLLNELKEIKRIIDLERFVIKWSSYEKIKKKGNYQDYSDLAFNSLKLLEVFPEMSEDFSYIVVDEFQDTNKMQIEFLTKIAKHRRIMVVGDINQSIYRFRGAYKNNLDIFKNEFSVSDSEIYTLAKSYRSPNKVLRNAYKLILNNYSNKEECFFVENVNVIEGEDIKVFELRNSREEARKVIEIIREEMKRGIALEDICVIYRAHNYGLTIRKLLEREGLEYYSIAKSSLLKQKSIKIVIDFLTILNKLKRSESGGDREWWDLFYNLNFGQNDLSIVGRNIKNFLKEDENKEKSVLSVYLFDNLLNFQLTEEGKLASRIFIERIKRASLVLDKPVCDILQETYNILGFLNDQASKEDKEFTANLLKFYETATVHGELYHSDLNNFLYYLEMLKNLGIDIDVARLEEKGVRLMSAHATKGLEYKSIILTNFSQGRFPIERYSGNSLIPSEILPELKGKIENLNDYDKEEFIKKYEKTQQILEERRLAYVSFTRSKERLFITYAREYGGKEQQPSQFLYDINYKNNEDIKFEIDNEEKTSELEFSNKARDTKQENESGFVEDREKMNKSRRLSPSALILFKKCQKEFEYKYVFNMPERKTISWEAMLLGSFVHFVLEKGVKSNFKDAEEFLKLAREIGLEEEWQSVSLDEAKILIRVFFERHFGRYNENSKTEQYLSLTLMGIDFMGFADRIDFRNGGVEIVDYKTGKTQIKVIDRNWQLGFYALAAEKKYGVVRKVVLDMLRQDKPLEFDIDKSGNAICRSSRYISGFNIYDVEKELVETAGNIKEAYAKGFQACSIEKNCEFCGDYVYKM